MAKDEKIMSPLQIDLRSTSLQASHTNGVRHMLEMVGDRIILVGGHSNVMWRGKDGREAKDMGPGQLEIMTVLSQFLYIFAPSRLNFNLQCIGVAINGLGGAMHRDAQIQGRLRTLATKQVELATTSGCFYPRSNHWEVEEGRSVTSVAAEFELLTASFQRLWRQFQTTGTAIRGSVVVVHEEPHPQMTGTLSYRPEETGGRQREKSPGHTTQATRTTDIAFYRGQKTARWWSVCTTPCTVCTFNASPIGEGVLCGAGNTGIGETMNGDEYSLQMRADSV
ncbi:hypothetical protein TNCV_1294071 [Trichonephila clavipes]|nr:hypothetical protein TNCV_1294071 [Trichonephila clavipes]